MPTYAYKCKECDSKYEVFHKVKEITEDIVCPSCGSAESKKLMTAAGISGFSASSGSYDLPQAPSCSSDCCSNGMCGLN